MNSNELNDTIITVYNKVIENLNHIKNISDDVKDKEWKSKEESLFTKRLSLKDYILEKRN